MIEKVLAQLSELQDFWDGIPAVYRAGSCLLLGIGLLLKATNQHDKDGRTFFVSGTLGFLMLAYGAFLFVGSK